MQYSFSQSLKGYVGIEGTYNSLPGAHVYLREKDKGTITDQEGFFVIEVGAGTYTLQISSIGFEPIQRILTISSEGLELDFFLKESIIQMPEVIVGRMTMTGGLTRLDNIPGSAHYLGKKELDKFSYGDVNRVLRNIPGVNMQEEDGFGLRPNIGMRGTGTERSSKITVMEDGILMAPAPYAAPAAYYFPYVGRMQGVEVRKGSSTIKYGPYTTGGALNFISTQVPINTSANLNMMAGNFGQRSINVNVGTSFKHGGFVAETYQTAANGFKNLDTEGNTGFNVSDYHLKLKLNTAPGAKIYQALNFKILSSSEVSDETYLGLTDQDFEEDPLRRYAGSQEDVMTADHSHYSLTYAMKPTEFLDITATAYRTDFARNWYKLDKVRSNSDSAAVGINRILSDPQVFSAEYQIITGTTSTNDNALIVKNNNREYYSKGLQGTVGLNFENESMSHDVEIGARAHYDQMDRFQWVDDYKMEDGTMLQTAAGIPGTESNRIESARALALYSQYTFKFRSLTVIPGLRYENIDISRDDYGKKDPDRTGDDLNSRTNSTSVWIPGVGVQYDIDDRLNVFAGMHKGFSPPGSKEGTNPEESINYELGFRSSAGGVFLNGTGFFNDYKNLLGVDLAAAGGIGSTDLFNGGAATVYGLEFEVQTNLLGTSRKIQLPLSLIYTYTKGYFDSSFESEFDGWGNVNSGDELPYMPNNQLSFNAALVHNMFEINFSSKYQDPMRTEPGQDEIQVEQSTDSQFVIDLGANVQVVDHIRFFAQVKNLTNRTYIVARRPAGVRPGMPRSFQMGFKIGF